MTLTVWRRSSWPLSLPPCKDLAVSRPCFTTSMWQARVMIHWQVSVIMRERERLKFPPRGRVVRVKLTMVPGYHKMSRNPTFWPLMQVAIGRSIKMWYHQASMLRSVYPRQTLLSACIISPLNQSSPLLSLFKWLIALEAEGAISAPFRRALL